MAEPRKPRSRSSRATSSSRASAGTSGELTSSPEVRTAFISGNTFRAKAVQYAAIDGLALFEGDIVLGTVEEVERQSSQLQAELRGELAAGVLITGSQYRWPNCTVPYDIDPALPNQARVTDAIAHWEANTRFRFVLRTAANAAQYPDWVTYRPGSGCNSSVGRRGGQQFVNLEPGCSTGNAIHETGHVVGMWHEQSREDRDAFVTINWANIQAGYEHNFDQHITDGDDIGAYDYGSIMHYPRDAFGINGAETITPKDPNAQIGQRTALSPGDIATANSMCPKPIIETFKEPAPETIKELGPETAKELHPETIKERFPETVKERFPETLKELSPETAKELAPETIKEQIETVKEQIETVKEQVETIREFGPTTTVEVVQPQVPGQVVLGGGLPFAMRTPSMGDAGEATDVLTLLSQQVAALVESVAALEANQAALSAQLAAVLGQLGLQ